MMKIKIVFTERPYENISALSAADAEEKTLFIKDPYHITMVDGGRHIVDADDTPITYEQYCIELQHIIDTTIRAEKLNEVHDCSSVIIVSCKEPPNFKALNDSLTKTNLQIAPECELIFKDCTFGGSLYVSSVRNFVKSVQKRQQGTFFNLTIDEQGQSKLSQHDQAQLAALNNVVFFPDTNGPAAIQRFADDQLCRRSKKNDVEVSNQKPHAKDDSEPTKKHTPLLNPTYFYRSQLLGKPSSETVLMNFFSQAHQQQSDYTCGPSALKMVADYFVSMEKRSFCGEPISEHQAALKILSSSPEFELAERIQTTEAIGSEIADMREGLMRLGLSTFDDCDGLSSIENDAATLQAHKEVLWGKIQQVLKLGIPVVINLRDRDEIGHYEVAIGTDTQQKIILSDPGAALSGIVEFDIVPKQQFLERWKNMSGERHGRYLIISPNEASAHAIEAIFQGVPHYFNGCKMDGMSMSM